MRMWLRRLRKLAGLNSSELMQLASAQWALIYAQLLVSMRPAGRLVTSSPAPGATDRPDDWEEIALQLSRAVNRAAGYGLFRPLCLVRSLALHRMLEARGLHGSEICVGVRQQEGGIAAHAWVRYQGMILGDTNRHVRRFTPLTDVRLASRR